jgi:iduronate 2-sulfatase
LFISVDDLNLYLGCYGHPVVRTPNIDRLASRGVRFSKAYAQWPSCIPSRFSFLSGWYPPRFSLITRYTKVRDGALKNAIYLPQHFKSNGFFTVRLDKVFHIGRDDPQSWNISEEPIKDWLHRNKIVETAQEIEELGLRKHIVKEAKNSSIGEGESRTTLAIVDVSDEQLIDGMTAGRAVEILKDMSKKSQPFFLAMGFRRPHAPWIVPEKYSKLYPPEKIILPRIARGSSPGQFSEQELRMYIAAYYAAISFMDAQVGKVLNALEETGLAKKTIVVFFGDQGFNLAERNHYLGKNNLFDRSLAVPLIIAAPRMAVEGRECKHVVQLLDLYPTLLSLCQLAAPSSRIQGRNLAPLLKNPDAPWDDWALSFDKQRGIMGLFRTIRTSRFRYIEAANGTRRELYDYETDPNESNNLIDDHRYSQILRELQSKLRILLRQIA